MPHARRATGEGDGGFASILLADAADPALRKVERTRLRLLAAVARQIHAGVAPGDLKVSAVTTSAGLAHGTFYRYFTDIRVATEALIEAFAVHVRDELARARDGEAGSRRRVRAATLVYARLFRDNAALMRCLIGTGDDATAFAGSYRDLNAVWNRRMAAAIARRRSGSGSAVTPESMLPVAYALGGMIDEFLAQIYLRRDPTLALLAGDDDAIADLLTDLWLRGAYGELPHGEASELKNPD